MQFFRHVFQCYPSAVMYLHVLDCLLHQKVSHPVPISSRTGLSLPGQLFPVHGSLPALVQLFLNALQHRNQFPWIGGF